MSNASNIINIPTDTNTNLEEKTTTEKVEKKKMSNASNIHNTPTDTNVSTSPKDLKLVTTCLSEIATFLKKIDNPQLIYPTIERIRNKYNLDEDTIGSIREKYPEDKELLK